jgi:hypothetical protein
VAYETFKRTSVRVEDPALSLTPDGRIVLNAAAARKMAEAGVKSVLLLWDKLNTKLAIKAAPKGDKNAFTVSFSHDKHAGSLRAKSFFTYIGWNAPLRLMLSATWDPKAMMLEVAIPPEFTRSSGDKGARKRIESGE